MGLIGRIAGTGGVAALGQAASDVAGVFTPNATRRMELSHEAYVAALRAAGAEFAQPRAGRFDAFVNGLNRLPRPMLALGTLGLFAFAMADPAAFSVRMQGLASVPEPLWWLLGAVVSFYFGAREAHHFRARPQAGGAVAPLVPAPDPAPDPAANPAAAQDAANPALEEWRRRGGA